MLGLQQASPLPQRLASRATAYQAAACLLLRPLAPQAGGCVFTSAGPQVGGAAGEPLEPTAPPGTQPSRRAGGEAASARGAALCSAATPSSSSLSSPAPSRPAQWARFRGCFFPEQSPSPPGGLECLFACHFY